jgi:two-component system, chemotaxis family, protein-glutamate methylesterase/glutaminase
VKKYLLIINTKRLYSEEDVHCQITTVKTELNSPTIQVADRVVAIAASKGGISALQKVLSHLPADFPGAMIIIQHLSPLFKSHLANILDRHTPLQVQRATDGAKLTSGKIYVAPPDHHVIVNENHSINLSQAAKEHFVRPSAEYTFKSLADNYQHQAIAVVLTGYDGDGSEGVKKIKAMGGKVIAQDKETSVVFGMPQSAIETGCVDLVLPLDKIADAIINMVGSR